MRKEIFCATLVIEFGIKNADDGERFLFNSRFLTFAWLSWSIYVAFCSLKPGCCLIKALLLQSAMILSIAFPLRFHRFEFGNTFVSLRRDPTWGPSDELSVAEWGKLLNRLFKEQSFVSKPLRSSPNATSSGGNGSEHHGEAAGRFSKLSKNTAWAYECLP